tara:strand:- start:99 stop:812 length:714 start_codon:yes stop_codon:yes gene_type:complete
MPDLAPTIDKKITTAVVTNVSTTAGIEVATEASGISAVDTGTETTMTCVNSSNFIGQFAVVALEFDTSDISSVPATATLKLFSSTASPEYDLYLVKGNFATDGAIVAADARNWVNDGSGNYDISNKVTYSSKIDTSEVWSNSEYNEISLNATARTDMANDDVIQIVVMDHFRHDVVGMPSTGGSVTYQTKIYMSEDTDGGRDPVLSYTEAAAAAITPSRLTLSSGKLKVLGGKLLIK